MESLLCDRICLLDIEAVSAIGLQSFRLLTVCYLGMGAIAVVLRQVGTIEVTKEVFKKSVKTLYSCPAHALSTHPVTPSGPAAFLTLTLHRVLLTL